MKTLLNQSANTLVLTAVASGIVFGLVILAITMLSGLSTLADLIAQFTIIAPIATLIGWLVIVPMTIATERNIDLRLKGSRHA